MRTPKRIMLGLSMVAVLGISARGQSGWTWQNPLPQGNSLHDVSFSSALAGWAVGDHGTIIRTTDGGQSWEIQESTTREALYAVHAADANVGWAVGYNGVILHTSDGGQHWAPQTSGTSDFLRDVFFLTASEGWAVGVSMRVLHTTDGGQSWTTLKSGGTDHLFSAVFVSSQEGWACGATGAYGIVYHTLDGGAVWQRQLLPTSRMNAVSFSSALDGWVTGDAGMIFRTTDGGASWNRQDASVTDNLRGVKAIDGSTIVAVGEGGMMLRTTNGGTTWETPASPTSSILEAVCFPSLLDGWAAGSAGTLVRTTDGGASWSSAGTGTRNHLSSIVCRGLMAGWAVGSEGTMVRTTDGGSSWSTILTGSPVRDLYDLWFCDEQTGWIVGDWGALRLTTDGGGSWQEQTISGHVANAGIQAIQVMETPGGGRTAWIACDLGFFYRTENDGATWQPLQTTCSNTIYSTCFVNKDTGWAVGMPRSDNPGTITVTTDGGETWSAQTNPRGAIGLHSVDFVNAVTGCAVGLSGSILTTDDGGATWVARTGVTSKRLNGVCLLPSGRAWAVGAEGTILFSSDFGSSWITVPSPTSNELEDVFFVDEDNGWIAGWNGTLLHTSDAGGVVSVEPPRDLLPRTSRLEQNYPNPFNPSTTIEYTLSHAAYVTLNVYSVLGEEVATLRNERNGAGTFTVTWDASGLPSGVYFYRLSAGGFVQTRKLVLMR